jgi:ribosomal protein S25
MPQQKSKNTKQNHWDRIDELLVDSIEPEGEGWFTRKEFQERYKLAESTASNQIRRLMASGKLTKWGESYRTKYRLKD